MLKHDMHGESDPSKTLGPRSAALVTRLHEQGRTVFRVADVRRNTGLSAASARSLARRMVVSGTAVRATPGLFQLVPFELGRARDYGGNPLLLARALVRDNDYCLSHGTAMEIHGMTTQPRLTVTVSTVRARRPVKAGGYRFRFTVCRPRDLFGITDHWATKQARVRVSDPERTVVDGLRHPEYCGGVTEVAQGMVMRRDTLNASLLIRYALQAGVGAVVRRLGYLLETLEMAPARELDSLRKALTPAYARLDPGLPARGAYLRRWRLRLNVPREEIAASGRTEKKKRGRA